MFARIRHAFRTAFYQHIKQAQYEEYLNGYRQGFNEGIEAGFQLARRDAAPKIPTHAWEIVHYVPENQCSGGESCTCADLDQQRPESLDWSINREVE